MDAFCKTGGISADTQIGKRGPYVGAAGAPGMIYESLQLYVDAGDRNTYPGSGTAVTDVQRNGSAGALVAPAVFADGAFLFDSASGNVNFAKSGDLNDIFGTSGPSNGGTVMVFCNPVSTGEGGSGRVVDTTDGLAEGYFIFLDNQATGVMGVQFARQFTGGNAQWDTDGRPVQRDGWNGITIRYDDTNVANDPTISVQGQTVDSNNTGAGPSGTAVSDVGNNLYIGGNLADDRTFNGQIAIVFMWNRILTDAEVSQAHNNFFARFARTGSVNGLLRKPGVDNTTSDELLADKGADSPTISITSFGGGNINLQSETAASRGIFGASTSYAAILSGRNNIIRDNNDFCLIAGGVDNEIDNTGMTDSVIGGGSANTLGDASNCVIAGGNNNLIKPGSGTISFGVVCGGERNDITGGSNGFIGGGEDNELGGPGSSQTTDWSTIGGGDTNLLRGDYGFIGGGFFNNIGVVIGAAAQYATIPGGRSNRIGGADVAGQRGDYGYASGRQSRVLFDGCTVMSDGNAVNADSIVAHEQFFAFTGGVRRVTTAGFHGEAWVKKNDHATTTTTTPSNNVIGTLATDQHSLTLKVVVSSTEGVGRSVKSQEFLVMASRDTTVQVLSTSLGGVSVGNAATDITYSFDVLGDDVRLVITDSVGNNYQHNWLVTKQEGGFAA